MTIDEFMSIREDEDFYHAVFQQLSPSLYRVDKDVWNHIAKGSIVSAEIVGAYRGIVPSPTRILTITLDKSCEEYYKEGL